MHQLLTDICWNVWKEYNNMIFKNIAHAVEECINIIYSDMRDWTCILSEEDQTDDFRDKEETER